MAQISVGKLLPNLKVTLGSDEVDSDDCSEIKDDEFSENEKKDTNDQKVEIVRSWMESLQNPKIYKNKSGGFTTGLDLLSEENAEALDKRAERFGLEKEEIIVAPNISALYESMDISIENRNSVKMKNVRLDTLHMRGVNDMNTHEIFDYFKEYGPASVEWINDFSCNVVWLDETSCARALLGVSKAISNTKSNAVEETVHEDVEDIIADQDSSTLELNDNQEKANMDIDEDGELKSSTSESSTPVDIPVPPGHWRLGTAHQKAKAVLLRFATKDDKKLPGAEKRSNYYKKYGNPNYGGLKGLISSSRKRKLQAAVNKQAVEKVSSTVKPVETAFHCTLQSETAVPKSLNSKPPRMRMYADDEELKTRKLWSADNFSEKQQSVHSRLGSKYTKEDLCHLGSSFRESRTDERLRDLDEEDVNPKQARRRNWFSENQVDLRTKLKRLRSDSSKEHKSETTKKYSRVDNLKRPSREEIMNKHRSPLCEDTESESDE